MTNPNSISVIDILKRKLNIKENKEFTYRKIMGINRYKNFLVKKTIIYFLKKTFIESTKNCNLPFKPINCGPFLLCINDNFFLSIYGYKPPVNMKTIICKKQIIKYLSTFTEKNR